MTRQRFDFELSMAMRRCSWRLVRLSSLTADTIIIAFALLLREKARNWRSLCSTDVFFKAVYHLVKDDCRHNDLRLITDLPVSRDRLLAVGSRWRRWSSFGIERVLTQRWGWVFDWSRSSLVPFALQLRHNRGRLGHLVLRPFWLRHVGCRWV